MVKFTKNGKKENCDILIPEDCKVGTSLKGEGKIKQLERIENNEIILDIGNETIKKILQKIDNSNTVLWNGPAGYFENKNFIAGTMSIAKKISENTKK